MAFDWNNLSGSVLGGRYVLNQLVSAGELSATFLTKLPDDDRAAIAETVASESPNSGTQLRSWSLAQGLAHSHLVRVFDAGEESLEHGKFIYAVKDRPEESLADVLKTRPLTTEEARQVVEAALLCLQYLHAKGCVHGAVKPSNIVAVDDTVKLGADTLVRSTLTAQDMYALGSTIVEVLTQKNLDFGARKLDPKSTAIVTALPSPLREIATGCLQPDEAQRWTAEQGLAALSNGASRPSSSASSSSRIPTYALLASVAVGCTAALVWSERTRTPAKAAQYVNEVDRPSPIHQRGTAERTSNPVVPRELPQSPQPKSTPPRITQVTPPRPAPPNDSGSDWAVIVATYKDFDMAQHFANSLQGRFKQFSYRVSPPRGKAEKYYYVVVGSGLAQDAARALQQRAIGAGLPSSSYVTRFPKASLSASR